MSSSGGVDKDRVDQIKTQIVEYITEHKQYLRSTKLVIPLEDLQNQKKVSFQNMPHVVTLSSFPIKENNESLFTIPKCIRFLNENIPSMDDTNYEIVDGVINDLLCYLDVHFTQTMEFPGKTLHNFIQDDLFNKIKNMANDINRKSTVEMFQSVSVDVRTESGQVLCIVNVTFKKEYLSKILTKCVNEKWENAMDKNVPYHSRDFLTYLELENNKRFLLSLDKQFGISTVYFRNISQEDIKEMKEMFDERTPTTTPLEKVMEYAGLFMAYYKDTVEKHRERISSYEKNCWQYDSKEAFDGYKMTEKNYETIQKVMFPDSVFKQSTRQRLEEYLLECSNKDMEDVGQLKSLKLYRIPLLTYIFCILLQIYHTQKNDQHEIFGNWKHPGLREHIDKMERAMNKTTSTVPTVEEVDASFRDVPRYGNFGTVLFISAETPDEEDADGAKSDQTNYLYYSALRNNSPYHELTEFIDNNFDAICKGVYVNPPFEDWRAIF